MNRLRVERYRRQLSQQALALRAGVSRPMLSSYEAGRAAPSVYVALRLAGQLGVPVSDLFPVEVAS